MIETVNQETKATEPTKTFTQDEVNNIVAERIGRERAKYEGFEDFKAKAEKLDKMEAANKTELEKANERAAKAESKLKAIEEAEKIRAIREEVAKETGVPVHLLTGNTKEDCTAQAAAIADYAKPAPYPTVKDGGEMGGAIKPTARQQFADWANSNFGG